LPKLAQNFGQTDGLMIRLRALFDYFRAHKLRLLGASIAPKVRIGRACEVTIPRQLTLGRRSTIEASVVVKLVGDRARLVTADRVFVGRGTLFDLCCELKIGEGTLIAPGCFIVDHNHGTRADAPIWSQPCIAGPVRIGSDVWLGAKVIVLPGVSIGDGAVVAAGSVVTHDVAPLTVVAGIPARFMNHRT
jgi:acetyltransferase-like isoleucine patch superfamily enzyme